MADHNSPYTGEQVDEAVGKALVAPSMEYTKKIGNPRNLLDGSDFRNPVNQRGQTSYKGAGYGIDRWAISSEAWMVSVEDGYIEVSDNPDSSSTATGMFRQYIKVDESLRGKTVTFAAKTMGKDVRLNINNAKTGYYSTEAVESDWIVRTITMDVPSDADTIFVALQSRNATKYRAAWAALYEGEYTVDTLPEYRPKGYAVELLACMRYYIEDVGRYIHGVVLADGTIRAAINIPVPMRVTPTVVAKELDNAVAYIDGEPRILTLTGVTVASMNANSVILSFATGLTAGTYQFASVTLFQSSIRLNADL